MNALPTKLRELLERLVEADVRFILVGGFAVNAWGHIRGTNDIDLVPDPDRENLRRLASLLEELGGKVDVGGRRLSSSAIDLFLRAGDKTYVVTELGPADVLQGLPQIPPFEELAASAHETKLEGIPVRICSLEHLLAMKRAAGRPMDLVDIAALEIAHGPDDTDA